MTIGMDRVLDNAQTAVFTSTKSTQYVQILTLGRKQTSRISRGTSDFRVAGVRPLSERQHTGTHYSTHSLGCRLSSIVP